MRQVFMLRIYPYRIKESACFLRDKLSPVVAFTVPAAYNLKLLACDKFMLTLFVQICNGRSGRYDGKDDETGCFIENYRPFPFYRIPQGKRCIYIVSDE